MNENLISLDQSCSLLEPDGSCDSTRTVSDCHCEQISSDKYHLTFIKVAAIADSGGTAYIKWPGKNGSPELTFDEQTLPEVTGMPL